MPTFLIKESIKFYDNSYNLNRETSAFRESNREGNKRKQALRKIEK
jgi:hypothetical protein